MKHFWTGKPKVFELTPFEPVKLVEYYHELWGYPHLFTPDALLELATMSRGVFRWFMRYIDLCLDNQILKLLNDDYDLETLTLDDVHAIIKPSQIVREWENEFKALYPRADTNRLTAEIIMRYLQKNGMTAQQTIRETFFDPSGKGATACTRMLTKLEANGNIIRTNVGREKYVELA